MVGFAVVVEMVLLHDNCFHQEQVWNAIRAQVRFRPATATPATIASPATSFHWLTMPAAA